MTPREIVCAVLLVGGLLFLTLGSIGIVRFPDFYSRLHPTGKSETMGASLVVLSLAVNEGLSLLMAKIILVQAFIFFANPAATGAMGRAAWRAGLRPWTNDAPQAKGAGGAR